MYIKPEISSSFNRPYFFHFILYFRFFFFCALCLLVFIRFPPALLYFFLYIYFFYLHQYVCATKYCRRMVILCTVPVQWTYSAVHTPIPVTIPLQRSVVLYLLLSSFVLSFILFLLATNQHATSYILSTVKRSNYYDHIALVL